MVMKNRNGQILSYLDNYRTKQEIFRQLLILYIIQIWVFIGNNGEDAGIIIEAKNLHKKKTPDNGVI